MVGSRKTIDIISYHHWILTALLVCCFASAASTAQKQISLAILVPNADERDFEVLKHAVETQLSDLGIKVSVEEKNNMDDIDTRDDVENLLSQKAVSIAVVVRGNSLLLLYDDGTSKEFIERELPEEERFEDSCDAVASMVRVGIEHLLLRDAVYDAKLNDNEENPEKDNNSGSNDETQEGDTSNADETDPSPPEVDSAELNAEVASEKSPGAWAGTWLGLGVELSYVLQVTRTVDTVRHGGYLGVRIHLTPYGALSVGAELLQPSKLKIWDWSFTYRRIPLRVTLAGYWPIKRVKLGVFASLLVDFTRIDGRSSKNDGNDSLDSSQISNVTPPVNDPQFYPRPPNDDKRPGEPLNFNDVVLNAVTPSFTEQPSRVFWGISPGLSLEVSLIAWLSVYLDAGADFIFNAHDYIFENGTSLYAYRSIQPHILIGVRFWFFNR